jgi:anaerobic dimethyl sulfoxide reductase subunit B (iron-sulfur subunit)
MVQYGFFFDQSRCDNCMQCAVACKVWNGHPPGPIKPLRMLEWETGTFTNVRMHFLFATCYHCRNPTCVDASNGGMYKEGKYGAVLIDPEKNTTLREAAAKCPYGAIMFESDALDAQAFKCNMCIDRLEQGKMPVCVMSCHMRALDFRPFDELVQKYGTLAKVDGFPDPEEVKPAIVFKPMDTKTGVVPYDASKALRLLSSRGSLPKPFSDPSEVTNPPQGIVGRAAPVFRPRNIKELMETSRNDEG